MTQQAGDFTVSTHFIRLLTDYAAARELSLPEFCRKCGFDQSLLAEADSRVGFSSYANLLDSLAEIIDEPHIGLALGRSARLAHLGTSGLAQMACRNVQELLPRMARYTALIMDAFYDDIALSDNEIVLTWRSRLPAEYPLSRHHAELNFSLIQSFIPQFAGREIFPTRVWFRHKAPENRRILDDFFRCEVCFEAPVDLIACDAEVLTWELRSPDPVTLQTLDRICEQQLKALGGQQEPGWLLDCKRAISTSLQNGQPGLANIASVLGMPQGQLRRKLADHGLNFRGLVEERRQELAEIYIADPDLSLVEVAVLLGFSEQSAFHRAYKRWTGEAPGTARRRLLASSVTAPR